MTRTLAAILITLLAASTASVTGAQVLNDTLPKQIDGIEIQDRRGESIPKDIQIYNTEGESVYIGDYFEGDRPIVLLLVYYSCPKMCEVMLNHMNKVINDVDYNIGEDYQVVVVSFDHTNTTSMAMNKETYHHASYRRGLDELGRDSYQFHTATAADARRLATSVGFDYRFLPQSGEFSHPSVMYVLTPEGRVSNYLSGIGYESKQLRLALLGASDGQIAQSIGDFFLQFCFVYDPTAGAYSLEAMNVMKIGGVFSVIGVGSLVGGLWITESVRKRRRAGLESNDRNSGESHAGRSSRLTKPHVSGAGS